MVEKYLEMRSPGKCQRCYLAPNELFTEHGCLNGTSHVWEDGTTSCTDGATCPICLSKVEPRRRPQQFDHAAVGVKTWYRAVDYLGPESDWTPVLALLLRGDGPLVGESGGGPSFDWKLNRNEPVLVFYTLAEMRDWAREHALYVIGLEPRR